MDWLKNRTVQRFAAVGFLGGLAFVIVGIGLELNKNNLPLSLWSFLYLHRTEPIIFVVDFAPVVLGAVGGLLGLQKSLSETIAQGKKEWETIFDSFSDLLFMTDTDGRVLRCNHAVVDRLNVPFARVIGKPLAELLGLRELGDLPGIHNDQHELAWLGRIYEVNTFFLGSEGEEQKKILHSA
jgi:PAS domain-containing protein